MRKLLAAFFFASICVSANCQVPAVIDSFKQILKNNKLTLSERMVVEGNLARTLLYVDLAESDKYGQMMIETAESSRDRKLMTHAYIMNALRSSYLAGRRDNIDKSIAYYKKALSIAQENKLDEEMVTIYIGLSFITRAIPDADQSFKYCNEANSYVDVTRNDSLKAEVHLEYGNVYLLKHQKLLALRNYLAALRIAEENKGAGLLRSVYAQLDRFYSSIEDYDQAIDYAMKSMQMLAEIKEGSTPYNRVVDLNRIGTLYSEKKEYGLAMQYFERSIALADTLKYEPLKVLSYRSIVDNYLDNNQPLKALEYFNEHPQLKMFLQKLNFAHFIDMSYGNIYTRLGRYDSAKYYYGRVDSAFQHSINKGNLYNYYNQLGVLYKSTGETPKAIDYFSRAYELANTSHTLDKIVSVSAELDTLYQRNGDLKQALFFTNEHHRYKDSLTSLNREKDLMQAEAADEQQRAARIAKEQAEKKTRQHNIQYRIITIGIVSLIIALVMLGMFKVSKTTIKMLGFFTFLMLFEFIFLLLKKQSYSITEGEPWKDLVMMILLAAILLPLHHWVEHKVIHYLTSHNRLTASGKTLRERIFKKKAAPTK